MKTSALKRHENTMNQRRPRLLMAEIMLQPNRLLRREAPILQVSACRPDRDAPSGVRLDESDNRLTRSKSERKLELVGALALNGPNDLRLLVLGNRSFLRPPSRLCGQSGVTAAFMSDQPVVDRLA